MTVQRSMLVGSVVLALGAGSLVGCGAQRRELRRQRREEKLRAREERSRQREGTRGQVQPVAVAEAPPPPPPGSEVPPPPPPVAAMPPSAPPPPPTAPEQGRGPMLAKPTAAAWTGVKKRVGVVEFEDTAQYQGFHGDRRALAASAQDVVNEALVQSGVFVVVEREHLNHLLAEQGLAGRGVVSSKSAPKVGQVLGLQALITGKITDLNVITSQSGFGGYYQQGKVKYHARVSLKLIDATTGEIWAQESGEGEAVSTSRVVMGGGSVTTDDTLGKRALYAAIHQVMPKLVAQAANKPWAGSVAAVKGRRVYVTGGSQIGLQPGLVLEVRHLGEEITDPATGEVLGREPGDVVGKLRIVGNLNERLSSCDVTRGARLAVGDQVTVDPTQTP